MLWVMLVMACGKEPECPNGLEYYEGFCLTPMGEGDEPWLNPGADSGTGETGDTGDTGSAGDTGDTGTAGDTGDTGVGDTGDSDSSDTGDTGTTSATG